MLARCCIPLADLVGANIGSETALERPVSMDDFTEGINVVLLEFSPEVMGQLDHLFQHFLFIPSRRGEKTAPQHY